MLKSIRMRLTAWHTGVLSIILAVFGTAVYFTIANTLYERLDSELASAADVIASSLAHEIQENRNQEKGEAAFRTVLPGLHQVTSQNCALAVFEGNRLVTRKHAANGSDPLPATPPRAPVGAQDYASRAGWRILTATVHIRPAQRDYVLMLAEPEAATTAELARLRRGILLAIPLTLLLAALGGWWMARKSLSPVMTMSQTVDGIDPSSLGRRVLTPNAHDELGRLGATFNRLLARLERAFDEQRQFMADAAHEMRTPVSIAHTAAQFALGQPHREETEYRDLFKTVEGQTRRLGRLVQDLFLLSRANAGPLPLRRELLYLDELVMDVANQVEVLARQKNIRVLVEGLKETPFRGDDELLRRLLMVLLDNAFQHTPSGSEVTIQFEPGDKDCLILVRDSGPGIPDRDIPHVFERFYRADKSRPHGATDSGGAGLGLPIGRTIAEAHGGSLDLISTGPEGSTFQIALPLEANAIEEQPLPGNDGQKAAKFNSIGGSS